MCICAPDVYMCMRVCMYVRTYVCTVCTVWYDMVLYGMVWYDMVLVCGYVSMWVCGYVCMCVCGYVGMWVCVCMCVCVYVCTCARKCVCLFLPNPNG